MREGTHPFGMKRRQKHPSFPFRDRLTHALIKTAEEMSREWKRVYVGDAT